MIMAIIRMLDHAFPAPTGPAGPARRIANAVLSGIALCFILGFVVVVAYVVARSLVMIPANGRDLSWHIDRLLSILTNLDAGLVRR